MGPRAPEGPRRFRSPAPRSAGRGVTAQSRRSPGGRTHPGPRPRFGRLPGPARPGSAPSCARTRPWASPGPCGEARAAPCGIPSACRRRVPSRPGDTQQRVVRVGGGQPARCWREGRPCFSAASLISPADKARPQKIRIRLRLFLSTEIFIKMSENEQCGTSRREQKPASVWTARLPGAVGAEDSRAVQRVPSPRVTAEGVLKAIRAGVNPEGMGRGGRESTGGS
ncbi:PREDICTED: uncharacterized protein LOC106149333 [Chinchilla lanigera]|uniref:uncharacterized protein LOC106149333 n=1 Tax=Chinchilla lanigera TaxID=34839 RepID=UPI000697580E|nr:PREDICTED: uncharacterized protein LOC106149333 [Chinchilla lanigera]